MSNLKIVNVLDPTAAQDVATKNYVDTRPDADVLKFTATIGDGVAVAIPVTHNLNTQDVVVHVRDATTQAQVEADIVNTSVNVVTVTFAVAPASGAFKVCVIG